MKNLRYLLSGMLFGIIAVKSEVVSWYRIHEMFLFKSFHMYGIIGSAIAVGALGIWLIKKYNIKDIEGKPIVFADKAPVYKSSLLGGTLFGLGWGLVGACPGPMYTLIGTGIWSIAVVIASAVLGTFVYGLVAKKLPH
jgi:uncharacterized membrane protein YedE/YeeE